MIYTWKHMPTGIKVEVERKASECGVPPSPEELAEEGLIEDDFKSGWERIVTGGSFTKGFGQKGYWAVMVLFLIGCGSATQTRTIKTITTEVDPCTVTQEESKAVILCPDGTSTILYPQIVERVVTVVQEVIKEVPIIKETIREVPIITENTQIVEVPVITEVVKEIYVEVPVITEVVKEVEVPIYIEVCDKHKHKHKRKKHDHRKDKD